MNPLNYPSFLRAYKSVKEGGDEPTRRVRKFGLVNIRDYNAFVTGHCKAHSDKQSRYDHQQDTGMKLGCNGLTKEDVLNAYSDVYSQLGRISSIY